MHWGVYPHILKDKGSLEAGKLADLVVLSDNPYKIDPGKIRNLQVALTMVGGKIVFVDDRLLLLSPWGKY